MNRTKPYLVDVPVRVTIWIRPECQRRQFEVLRQARPSVLFLQSDGGRNEREWAAIRQNREMFDNEVDWDCTIHKLYEESNLGLYAMSAKTSRYIWEHTDRCIFLEDDLVPSVSYFRFCAELLERYKDDLRVDRICGLNHLGTCEDVSGDYFFSRQGGIWGTATWRRAVAMRDTEFAYGQDPYTMKALREFAKDNPSFMKRAEGYATQTYYENHIAGGEFYHGFAAYGQHQLSIIPKKNMISNIGCTSDSTHADALKLMPRAVRRTFCMKTYEVEFPLRHTRYMIPDLKYEKKIDRLGAYNAPCIRFFRRIERVILLLLHGKLFSVLEKKRKSRGSVET